MLTNRTIMKFHHINRSIIESAKEDDPFADSNPTDLKVYLAKLEAQRSRAHSYTRITGLHILEFEQSLRAATGESSSICIVSILTPLRPGWTCIGCWQLSPRAMSEPSVSWIIHYLSADEHDRAARADICKKLNLVKKQIKLAKDAQKSKPL